MIVDLLDTTTTAVNKKLDSLREQAGMVMMGCFGTLIIKSDNDTLLEEAIEAANHEHPSWVLVVAAAGNTDGRNARLDAQVRFGGDAGAGEVVVLRLSGPLSGHAASVVIPFLLPDIPVVVWWPDVAPAVPAQDPLGKLAIRRITDAINSDDPLSAIKSRLPGYTAGDTDLAWARTPTGARCLPRRSTRSRTRRSSPPWCPACAPDRRSTSWPAGWPAASTVRCAGTTATLSRTGRPDALVPLARREPATAWPRT